MGVGQESARVMGLEKIQRIICMCGTEWVVCIEKVKTEKDGPYDANQYFYILKMALDLHYTKLTEIVLGFIGKYSLSLFPTIFHSFPFQIWDDLLYF